MNIKHIKYPFVCRLAVFLWIAHFVKREFETVWVHRFSRPTMPMINLLKNSWYYWMFACLVAYVLCHPAYVPPSNECVAIGAVGMLLAELANLVVHVQLRNLRPAVCALEVTLLARFPAAPWTYHDPPWLYGLFVLLFAVVQEGSTVRPIPAGGLFTLVSCPNYTAGILRMYHDNITLTCIGLVHVCALQRCCHGSASRS